jgi:hypothetical protein
MQRLVVAALRVPSVVLLWELLVAMATPAPETSWGPPAVAKTLALVTLNEDSLPVCFNFYTRNDFGEKGEFENRL